MKEPIIRKELNNVWLNKAKETVLNNKNIEEFYLRSGNKFIINEITEYLQKHDCEPQLVFFEHSYFATTLDDNKYTIFACIWKTENLTEFQKKKFLSFFTTLGDTFERAYPILWHPEFFISRDSVSFYISQSNASKQDLSFDVTKYVKEEYEGESQIFSVPDLPNGESVYVGNFPFTLPFEELVKEIIKQKQDKSRTWQPIEENNDRIRIAYDKIFDKKKDEFSYKLSIPILGSPVDENSEYVGQGSVWIYIISKKEIEVQKLKYLAEDIAGYFKDISINYIFQSGLELAKASIKQATRAAIAQVMARNMSHNIGSHVLNKVYQVLIVSQEEEDLRRAAHLFEFIQKRMEFIANGVNAPFQSSHFLFKEILPPYLQEPIEKRLNLKSLFDNISGNQIITSENIFFKIEKGLQDIQVSIPNGTLGFHALYTLLENIIRNSVKHNQSYPADRKLIYTLSVGQDSNGEFSDYYRVSITDNFGEINEQKELKIISLNSNMNQPILNNGSLRPNYWGLLEMKICATYLLGLPIDLIDSANKLTGNKIEINGIDQAFPAALLISQDSDKNLVHTFYLQKPKVAAVTRNIFKQNETEGIELVTSRLEFDKIGSKHLFAVFEKEEAAKEHETKTNQRSIFISENTPGKTSVNENILWNTFAEQKGWNVDDVEIVNIIDYANDGSLFPVNPNKRYIIFDHHQDWWEKQENKKLITNDSQNFLYYEYVNSLSTTTTAITKPIQLNSGVADSVLKVKIFETAFTDIIVLDERIQKNYGQLKLTLTNPQSENPFFSNLFIPPYEGETDLDKAITKDILEWEKTISIFKKDYKLNYLIIHRSIIGKDRIDIDELKDKLKPDFTIFVSGGGTPPNLKDGEFYLPFDVLNYCLGSNPNKFALVGILKSLRKIKK